MSFVYPIADIRRQFPALRNGNAFFDSPGGTQTPTRVADAIHHAMVSPVSQRGRGNFSEANADRIVVGAREAMADLLGADPSAVFFGRSATQINFDMARAFARQLSAHHEIVVSRLDHDANVRPWVDAAAASGAALRWIDFDPTTGDLTPADVEKVLTDRTRIVAVTAASNLFGTAPDIPGIAELVHGVGAELYVDAVAYAAHEFIDLEALGADYIVCSPYKFCGPHIGVLASNVEKLEGLQPYKLRPSTMRVPERFELGTLPYEVLSGITEAVNFLAGLIPTEGTRRAQIRESYAALRQHEMMLFDRMIEGFSQLPAVTRVGAPRKHIPTALFNVEGLRPGEVAAALGDRDVACMHGTFYSIEAEEWADLGNDGAVRAGVAPYTSIEDVDRLLWALSDITS